MRLEEPARLTRRRLDGVFLAEDDLGEGARRGTSIGMSQAGLRTQLALQRLGGALEAGGDPDPAPMVWDALCRLEPMIQERRGAAARGRRAHVELLGAE